MTKPTVICLTPVRNEAWILHRFLECASLWADYIIIADQNSDDGSREIALSYPKVRLIENSSLTLDEVSRQQLLIEEARKIPGPRLLIAFDSDEMLTANFMDHPEWNTVLSSSPGTIIEFQWVNILPSFDSYWSPIKVDFYYPLGFMDDGSEHIGNKIHSPRIPEPPFAPRIRLQSIKLLHYAYTDWKRMESKHRWYQCWERINRSSQSPVWLYRFYKSSDSFPSDEIFPIQKEWFTGYEERGIDMTSTYKAGIHWRDEQILKWMSEYGSRKFKKLAIWNIDWSRMALKLNIQGGSDSYNDPRGWLEKIVHFWLKQTQPRRRNLVIRLFDRILSFFF